MSEPEDPLSALSAAANKGGAPRSRVVPRGPRKVAVPAAKSTSRPGLPTQQKTSVWPYILPFITLFAGLGIGIGATVIFHNANPTIITKTVIEPASAPHVAQRGELFGKVTPQ